MTRSCGVAAVASLLVLGSLAGCHVSSHKNGGNDNVDIGTPFGSMQVKTNDNVNGAALGITQYPGSVAVKKDKDGGDDGAADVNMNFGGFHLGVKAVSFTTPDDPAKVLAFYKKDLAKYGAVITCEGKRTVGEPTRTAEGLTCDYEHDKHGHIQWDTDSAKNTELRTGSKQHQHVVAVERKDGATKIGLIALDLPSGLSTSRDSKSSD